MVTVHGKITYRGGSALRKVKGLRGAIKEAFTKAVLLWHREMLPDHFAPLAAVQGRYPGVYQARTRKYQIRKGKKYGHQNLLVYSGELRGNVTHGVTVTATSKSARARLPGSNKANFKANSRAPDMRSELVSANESEVLRMAKVIDDHIGKFLNSKKETETKTF